MEYAKKCKFIFFRILTIKKAKNEIKTKRRSDIARIDSLLFRLKLLDLYTLAFRFPWPATQVHHSLNSVFEIYASPFPLLPSCVGRLSSRNLKKYIIPLPEKRKRWKLPSPPSKKKKKKNQQKEFFFHELKKL